MTDKEPDTHEIVQCPACLCIVHPLKVKMAHPWNTFMSTEYDCPKCGEQGIWKSRAKPKKYYYKRGV